MTPAQQPQREYIITEELVELIEGQLTNEFCKKCPHEGGGINSGIKAHLRTRQHTPAPSHERIGSIRQNIYQEDAYLIERVNAGMGEWEYVIQYCGEYYATTPSEEIARSIVELAQHTCPVISPHHDAAIARTATLAFCEEFLDYRRKHSAVYGASQTYRDEAEFVREKIESLRGGGAP